jgi:hypothetical protein
MIAKGIITVVLSVLLTVTASWAGGGGGGGGGGATGGSPIELLMPDPPRNVTATAGDGEATISFQPPKSDGGSSVTSYTVTAHPGGIRVSGKQSPITVKGLTNGRTYSFTVTASNSVGTGLASEACNSVTPKVE